MPEIFDIHREKLKIENKFKKTPIASMNDQYFGLAWFEGEYKLHKHNVDEVFLVLEGHLSIQVDDDVKELGPGMGIVVKAGEKHKTKASRKTLVGIFEPKSTEIEFLE